VHAWDQRRSKTISLTTAQKVEQILAIGDSYTAGIGANGIPYAWGWNNCSRYSGAWPVLLSNKDEWKDFGKDGKQPFLTFGACSGNVMEDVREKMLEQGPAKDTRNLGYFDNPYTPIGKPQIAVMTISGNDMKFSGIITDCIFRYKPKMGCDPRLDDSRRIVESADFKNDLRLTFAKVISAGREAEGADPPESFQLYVGKHLSLLDIRNNY
jgi:lysophospholipase L1-like esterase